MLRKAAKRLQSLNPEGTVFAEYTALAIKVINQDALM